jgi:hypothetical protein
MSDTIFNLDSLKIIVVKFGYNPFGSFRGEDLRKSLRRRTSLHQVEVVRRPLIWDIAPEMSNFAIFGFYLKILANKCNDFDLMETFI